MLRTNGGLARMLTSLQSITGSWRYLLDYDQQIASVTADEIREVVTSLLVPENRTVMILERNGEGS